MDNFIIELKNVWKVYPQGKVNALKNINLKIKKGDFLSIMGPSGSGKSSLMNLIGLLDKPTKGKIFFEGKDTSKFSEENLSEIRGSKIGFVFQMFNLVPTLTTLENIMLPAMFKTSWAEAEKRAIELLKKVNLEERFNHLPKELSGGEQQRIAIARALINNPEVILADEPTGNLDSKTGTQIMKILNSLHKEGKTVVVITHDPIIANYAKKIINIIDGSISKDHVVMKKYVWKNI